MNKQALIEQLQTAGIELYVLKSTRLNAILDSIVNTVALKDERIATLENKLRKREKRREQRRKSVPGGRVGAPAKHRHDEVYWQYWKFRIVFERPYFMSIKRWLENQVIDIDGELLDDKRRAHIRRMLSERAPSDYKLLTARVAAGEGRGKGLGFSRS